MRHFERSFGERSALPCACAAGAEPNRFSVNTSSSVIILIVLFFSKSVTDITTHDLAELLASSAVENVLLEFKRDVPDPADLLKKLSGFANTFGGYLIVGASAASTDGRLVAYPGVEARSNYRQSVVQRCYEGLWPPLADVIVSDGIAAPGSEGRFCYVIYVPESLQAPHFLTERRGAWIRTDEFSQRFDTTLATFEEIQHLANRRALAVSRREQIYARSIGRFDALVSGNYAANRRTSGDIGATFYLSICPHFPTRPLLGGHELLEIVRSTLIPWRGTAFPANVEVITQLDSALLLHPVLGFSLTDANIWGQLTYCCEIEEAFKVGDQSVSGIHLYAFLGHVLVFLEHARQTYRKFGYNANLLIRILLKRIRGKPFVYAWYGNLPVTGRASPIDDEVSLEISVPARRLNENRDEVAGDLLKELFFCFNWPEQGADEASLLDLMAKAAMYNGWRQ